MLATKVICPHCAKHLKTSKPLTVGHRVLCSRCGRSFAVPPDASTGPSNGVMPSPAPVVEGLTQTSPMPRAETPPLNPVWHEKPALAPNRQAVWIGVVLGGLLLVMGATLGLVVYFATRKAPQVASVQASTVAPDDENAGTSNPASADAPRLLPPNDGGDPPPPPPELGRSNDPPLLADPPSLPTPTPERERASWLPPEEQEQVNKAIDLGVQWLKTHQKPRGSWGGGGAHDVGLAALPALTLLECGVPADDSRVQKAVHHVRKAIPKMTQTYELALIILFLDRLGDPADEKLIQTCALRLVAGQSKGGGWTYQCPALSSAQESDLLLVMQQTRPKSSMDLFVGGANGSAPPGFLAQAPGAPPDKSIQGDSTESKLLAPDSTAPLDKKRIDPEAFKKALTRLPPNLRGLPALQPPEKSHKMPATDGTDNSNTQFAILGLSAAQRHNLPLERALALIVRRFRTSQWANGRWGYHYSAPPRPDASSPAMTGAGLLGLAVGLGLAADHTQPKARSERFEDPAIEKAFAFLGENVGKALGVKNPRNKRRTPINMYFMWTLERCGVLFNRREIAGKDWYHWGSELLVDNQNDDGTWMAGGYPGSMPIADTCFALLFLKRANLAKDLTKKLEFFMEGKKLQGP